jgi:UTP--glucose-1-phosphate uridylyltransferase
MTGAKSALEVKDDMTFLDLTVHQIEHLNTTRRVDVPLVLMTSFNMHEDTLRIIKKYANQQLRITTFNQSRYQHILKETLLPAPKTADDDKKNWYLPGHGDLYNVLHHSGVLDPSFHSLPTEYLRLMDLTPLSTSVTSLARSLVPTWLLP